MKFKETIINYVTWIHTVRHQVRQQLSHITQSRRFCKKVRSSGLYIGTEHPDRPDYPAFPVLNVRDFLD